MTESSKPDLRQAGGLGWALLAALLALPWLIETHVAPWTMFYPDWGMAAVMLVLIIRVLAQSAGSWRVTPMPLGIAALAVVPLLQAATGLIGFPSEGLLASIYLVGFMLAILVGLRTEVFEPGRAADALFTGLAMAAILSVGLQLYQWLQLDGFGVLVMPASGRPFANVGQPNLLSTLLIWGLIALWWGLEQENIGSTVAAFAAMFLLLGVAMTQSRAGWLAVGLLAVVAGWQSRGMRRALSPFVLAMLGLWFIGAVLVWPHLADTFGMSPTRSVVNTAAVSERFAIWRLAADAIATRPWAGWGWNQGGEAHVALAARHLSLPALNQYMHNLVLDLMVWNGIPIGALATLGLGGWFILRWREKGSAQQRLLLLALAVFLIHAMLELPHGYAVFLLPAGLMMGLVEAHSRTASVLTVPRWAVGGLVLALALALGLLASEHRAVEQDLLALRMRAAKIANLPPLGPPPVPMLMAPLGELLVALRVAPAAGLDVPSLELLRRVAYHYPSTGNLFRLAQAEALNGRPSQARDALIVLCQVQSPADCKGAAQHWRELGLNGFPTLTAIDPPDPPRSAPAAAGDAATMPRPTSQPR